MKKKFFNLFLILFILALPIHSISFGFHVFDIRTDMDFASGILPTSLLYQFNFPIPELLAGNKTEVNFRIDNGLDFRTLKQDPITGIPFAENPENPDWNYPKEFISIYDEMNLIFAQGFLSSTLSDNDLLRLWTSFDLRFENYYERFNYLNGPENAEGLFMQATPYYGERFTTWIGQPELEGDRSTSNISFSLGFDVDYMENKITRRNGLKNSFGIRLNPKWTDFFKDGTQDFIMLWNKLDLALTLFHIDQKAINDRTWLSMVVDNSTTYRYITGNKVPYYAHQGNIFGSYAVNTEHIIKNRTSLTIYGPQINSYDCYPYVSGFFDIGFSFGNLLNTKNPTNYTDTVLSAGIRAEFILFNVASCFYEIGYVFNNTLNLDKKQIIKFGFSFGV